MKICLYSPYVPQHTGGGEKYFFDVARMLAEQHQVVVGISDFQGLTVEAIRAKYESFLDASLAKVEFIPTPLGTVTGWKQKLDWTKQFEVMYYLTDGSLFFSRAGKNILHVQIPFTGKKNSPVERLKLHNWKIKNTNSNFTKKIIEKAWSTKVQYVHWPMIEVPEEFQSVDLDAKKPIILHVGRFFSHLHTKRQDVLVEFFKRLVNRYPKTMKKWQLVLVGTVDDEEYAQKVRDQAEGYRITFIHQATRKQLWDIYRQSSIYWHATGFDVDETKHPEKVEHFGISTVEAMAMGCVPVVINKGGQPEVVGESLQKWLWSSQAECLSKTLRLVEDKQMRQELQALAQIQAKTFNQDHFKKTLTEMIGQPV